MTQKNTSVLALVNQDLNTKVEQGFTIDQIKAMSQNDVASYESYFRQTYAHRLNKPFKNGTVNRYLEQWIKRNSK